jgi:hypothetical protein
MTLMLELSPELAQRLEEEAARHGQAPSEFAQAVVEEKLTAAPTVREREEQVQRNHAALALLRQWRQEDTENPDLSPVPVVSPLSLREVKVE